MDKQEIKRFFRVGGIASIARVFVVASLITLSIAGIGHQVHATQTSAQYCANYTGNSFNACQDGILGTTDCSDYAIISTQSDADICSAAKTAKSNGQISDMPSTSSSSTSSTASSNASSSTASSSSYKAQVTATCGTFTDATSQAACLYGGLGKNGTSTKPSTDCYTVSQYSGNSAAQSACAAGASAGQAYLDAKKSSDSNSNSNALDSLATNVSSLFSSLDLNDTKGSLSSYIDTLHSTGTDAKTDVSSAADNNLNSYVNGAGQQQPITVWQCNANTGSGAAAGSTPTGTTGTSPTNTSTTTTNTNNGSNLTANQIQQAVSNALQQQQDKNVLNNAIATSVLQKLGISGTSSTSSTSSITSTSSSNYTNTLNSIIGALGGKSTSTSTINSSTTNSITSAISNALGISGASAAGGKSLSGSTKCPAILWINGGGWHTDDGTAKLIAEGSNQKNGDNNMTEDKPVGGGANARGYTVIEISYRLGSSGVNYMFEDVMRGIQHVLNNASRYNIDPTKMVVGGDSAGGSLAVRAVASGKSGAKVGVGWSAPTNAYTALFKSYKTFLIGMDHSTCIPTDLAGLDNTLSELNGGGQVAQYGVGLGSNSTDGLGLTQGANAGITGIGTPSGNPLLTIGQVLQTAQYAMTTGQNLESISKKIQSGDIQSLFGGVFNLSANTLINCIQNFNTLSPALFASTETPATFLAGFNDDDLIDPQQLHDMADKLKQMGIKSDVLTIPGDPQYENRSQDAFGATPNHLGYDPRFVCPTINFIDSVIQPGTKDPDCSKPSSVAQSAPTTGTGSGGGSSSGGRGANGGAGGSSGGGSGTGTATVSGGNQVTTCSGSVCTTTSGSATGSTVNSNVSALPPVPGGNTVASGGSSQTALSGGSQASIDGTYIDPDGNRVSAPSGQLNDLGWADDNNSASTSVAQKLAKAANPEVGIATTILGDTPLGSATINCLFGSCPKYTPPTAFFKTPSIKLIDIA